MQRTKLAKENKCYCPIIDENSTKKIVIKNKSQLIHVLCGGIIELQKKL